MNPTGLEHRTLKALSHPLRLRILEELHAGVASPSELAQHLGQPLHNVSYHVRALARLEMIELVRTEPRRGALEHFYRAIDRAMVSDEEWGNLPIPMRRGFLGLVLGNIARDLRAAGGPAFDAETSHLSRSPMILDRGGWDEVAELLEDTLERIEQIRLRSKERLAESDEAGFAATAVIMLFEGSSDMPDTAWPKR